MALLCFSHSGVQRLDAPPATLPAQGFVWWQLTRTEAEGDWAGFAAQLQAWQLNAPIELHQQDLLNPQHPSHYDYTSDYDLVIFRRLSLEHEPVAQHGARRTGPTVLKRIRTQAVGFLMYDRVLVTVHGEGCATAEDSLRRFAMESARRPTSPADLMLRITNTMVDSYLELRKVLATQLDHWQIELLDPRTRFVNWRALLAARNDLHALEDVCDEQHDAMQEWLDALQEQPVSPDKAARAERDLLAARSRDVIEHISRVQHHVRRLETSAETAVQMHFNAQSHRTNDIMRTLTALTAIFLPLNLITGFFGMNFDFLPLIHEQRGLWVAIGAMILVAVSLILLFWRKRYLARTSQ
jgi:magnesium transporter